jgi:hypothetical protein
MGAVASSARANFGATPVRAGLATSGRFAFLPIRAVEPLGWLREQLQIQASGLSENRKFGDGFLQQSSIFATWSFYLAGFRIKSRHSRGFSLLTFASIFSGEMGGREVAELQHSQKFMKQVDAGDMRQTLMITGDFYISWRIAYFTNFSPPVRNS